MLCMEFPLTYLLFIQFVHKVSAFQTQHAISIIEAIFVIWKFMSPIPPLRRGSVMLLKIPPIESPTWTYTQLIEVWKLLFMVETCLSKIFEFSMKDPFNLPIYDSFYFEHCANSFYKSSIKEAQSLFATGLLVIGAQRYLIGSNWIWNLRISTKSSALCTFFENTM